MYMPFESFSARIVCALAHALALFSILASAQDSDQKVGPCYNTFENLQIQEYQPCVAIDGVTSFCCGLNRTIGFGQVGNGDFTRDKCLSIGLCEHIHDGETQYWRQGCTDKNFPSPACLSMCKQSNDGNGSAQMTPCDDTKITTGTKWCCGENNFNCCKEGSSEPADTLPPIYPLPLNNDSASNSNASSNTNCSLTPSASGSCSGLSAGAGAGIGVGATVAVFGLLTALFFVMQRRKNARHPQPAYAPAPSAETKGYNGPPQQLDSREVPVEAHSTSTGPTWRG